MQFRPLGSSCSQWGRNSHCDSVAHTNLVAHRCFTGAKTDTVGQTMAVTIFSADLHHLMLSVFVLYISNCIKHLYVVTLQSTPNLKAFYMIIWMWSLTQKHFWLLKSCSSQFVPHTLCANSHTIFRWLCAYYHLPVKVRALFCYNAWAVLQSIDIVPHSSFHGTCIHCENVIYHVLGCFS